MYSIDLSSIITLFHLYSESKKEINKVTQKNIELMSLLESTRDQLMRKVCLLYCMYMYLPYTPKFMWEKFIARENFHCMVLC